MSPAMPVRIVTDSSCDLDATEAEIKRRGANTFLGNLWWVLDPLLLMAVYVVLVTVIFNRSIPDYPLA